MGHILDIIICTYDREELLCDCINSLLAQSVDAQNWLISVVNNSPQDFCGETMMTINKASNIRVIKEPQAGLSIARNTGITNSEAEWLGFLDDDAKVPPDYISKILEIINTEPYDCFGGHIISWWKYGKPRWLSDSFGSKPIIRNVRSSISEEYNWGSNIIINKAALEDAGRFPTYIGMKGDKLGYAAENIVQIKLREKGYLIGYDPNLVIEHVVMLQKLKMIWHLKSAYATGRDGRSVYKDQYSWGGILISLKNCFSRPIKQFSIYLARRNIIGKTL